MIFARRPAHIIVVTIGALNRIGRASERLSEQAAGLGRQRDFFARFSPRAEREQKASAQSALAPEEVHCVGAGDLRALIGSLFLHYQRAKSSRRERAGERARELRSEAKARE